MTEMIRLDKKLCLEGVKDPVSFPELSKQIFSRNLNRQESAAVFKILITERNPSFIPLWGSYSTW
jgi:hypothetical protein